MALKDYFFLVLIFFFRNCKPEQVFFLFDIFSSFSFVVLS